MYQLGGGGFKKKSDAGESELRIGEKTDFGKRSCLANVWLIVFRW